MRDLISESTLMTSVTLTWLPPPRQEWNGLLSAYTVIYEPQDDGLVDSGNSSLQSVDFRNDPHPRNDSG